MINLDEIKTKAQLYKERLTSEVITPYSDLSWAADTIIELGTKARQVLQKYRKSEG